MPTKRTNRTESAKEKAQAETRRWLEEHPESDAEAARGFEEIRQGHYTEVKRPAKKA